MRHVDDCRHLTRSTEREIVLAKIYRWGLRMVSPGDGGFSVHGADGDAPPVSGMFSAIWCTFPGVQNTIFATFSGLFRKDTFSGLFSK